MCAPLFRFSNVHLEKKKTHWGSFGLMYIFYYINEFGPYRPLLRQINKRTPLSPSSRLLHLCVSPGPLMSIDLHGSKTYRCENSKGKDNVARTIDFRNLKTLPKIPRLKERKKREICIKVWSLFLGIYIKKIKLITWYAE